MRARSFVHSNRNFHDQAQYLIEGGVDLLLIETSQDILEVKAAVAGIEQLFKELSRRIPLQAQVTLDVSGQRPARAPSAIPSSLSATSTRGAPSPWCAR